MLIGYGASGAKKGHPIPFTPAACFPCELHRAFLASEERAQKCMLSDVSIYGPGKLAERVAMMVDS